MSNIVVIPSRLNSTRLLRKALLKLGNKSVIQRVFEQSKKARIIDRVYIATDSDEIIEHCKNFTDFIIKTSSLHQSGTDRIVEAITSIRCDVVINVQGDEPFIQPELIEELKIRKLKWSVQ